MSSNPVVYGLVGDNKFFNGDRMVDRESVDVQARTEIFCIDYYLVGTCLQNCIHDGFYFASLIIVEFQIYR
jgi:hypothetical protein